MLDVDVMMMDADDDDAAGASASSALMRIQISDMSSVTVDSIMQSLRNQIEN